MSDYRAWTLILAFLCVKTHRCAKKSKKLSIPDSRFLIVDGCRARVLSILLFSYLDAEIEFAVIVLLRVASVKGECGKSKMGEGCHTPSNHK